MLIASAPVVGKKADKLCPSEPQCRSTRFLNIRKGEIDCVWVCCPLAVSVLFGDSAKKVIDQPRRSWQTLRTLLGVARRGHHSGSKRDNNRNSQTITKKHQLLVVGPATIKMPHRKLQLLVQTRKSGMLTTLETTTATTTTLGIITTTSSRIRTTKTRTLIMKSAIGLASKIQIGSKRIPCAAGVRNRKVCVITGAAGRNLLAPLLYLGSMGTAELPKEVSLF